MTAQESHKRAWPYFVATACVLGGAAVVVFLMHSAPAPGAPAEAADAQSVFRVDGDFVDVPQDTEAIARIQTVTVRPETAPVTITCTGRTGLDMERVTHVRAQFPGRVTKVGPELGTTVKGPGEAGGPTQLCVIESTDLANAKSAYLKTQIGLKLDEDNLVRTKELLKSHVLADKFLLDAESAVTKDQADLEAARQQLLVFGLTDKDIEGITNQQGRQRMEYAVTSPRTGQLTEKGVVGGELADPTLNLFTVADTSRLWVWGSVYERDREKIREGQRMRVILTSQPDQPREATVDWISPVIDADTRSIKVRGSLANKDGRMLAEMYATLIITVDDGTNALLVPADAVVRRGADAYVFVRVAATEESTRYRRTAVKIEPVSEGIGLSEVTNTTRPASEGAANSAKPPAARLRVTDGIEPGQTIVSSGALGLFSEMEQQASK